MIALNCVCGKEPIYNVFIQGVGCLNCKTYIFCLAKDMDEGIKEWNNFIKFYTAFTIDGEYKDITNKRVLPKLEGK